MAQLGLCCCYLCCRCYIAIYTPTSSICVSMCTQTEESHQQLISLCLLGPWDSLSDWPGSNSFLTMNYSIDNFHNFIVSLRALVPGVRKLQENVLFKKKKIQSSSLQRKLENVNFKGSKTKAQLFFLKSHDFLSQFHDFGGLTWDFRKCGQYCSYKSFYKLRESTCSISIQIQSNDGSNDTDLVCKVL